ncbi:BrnT family toxin [Maritalea sp.]|uniref:BrnT family toxin n=1 Tax=Maritalea sp. TaxID=2003361 RepID=UPI003EF9F351
MQFEYDDAKRRQVYRNHGVDMLYAALIFENEVLTRLDDRKDYSEERYISLGMVDGEPYIVVHTERNDIIRLITAWKGGRNDKKRYENRHS